jgi:predicted MPP superfamily phosphohydrolase
VNPGKWLVVGGQFCLSLVLAFGLVVSIAGHQVEAEARAATLLRWPYLQQVTSTSAHIIWTTDVHSTPSLKYGIGAPSLPAASVTSRSVSTPDGDYSEHKAVLGGLQPNTRYNYQIFEGSVNLTPAGQRRFQTAPSDGGFTFAAFGDSGSGTAAQYRVRDQMLNRQHDIDFFLHTGDLAYVMGAYDEFRRFFFEVYQELLSGHPLFPAMGNHEYNTDNGGPYLDLFDLPATTLDPQDAERYYSFDWGSAHFVALDSEDPLRRISDASDNDMGDWLEADLAADDHTWKIVIIHRPPYSSSPIHTETDVREKLVPIFEAYGVDLVLAGHNHNYERTYPLRNGTVSTLEEGGIVYVVTGGGGRTLYPVPGDWFTAARAIAYHFVQGHVTECALQLAAIDQEGAVIDQALLNKCPYRVYLPFLP